MLTIVETHSFRYPFRVVIKHPHLRMQGFAFWHREKERIKCGLDDGLDAMTMLFSNRSDAERLVSNITKELSSPEFRPAPSEVMGAN